MYTQVCVICKQERLLLGRHVLGILQHAAYYSMGTAAATAATRTLQSDCTVLHCALQSETLSPKSSACLWLRQSEW